MRWWFRLKKLINGRIYRKPHQITSCKWQKTLETHKSNSTTADVSRSSLPVSKFPTAICTSFQPTLCPTSRSIKQHLMLTRQSLQHRLKRLLQFLKQFKFAQRFFLCQIDWLNQFTSVVARTINFRIYRTNHKCFIINNLHWCKRVDIFYV